MAWIYLLVAGVLEVLWALGLKYTDGWTKPIPTVFTLLIMVASFYCLAQAVREIPIGTGYAIWTGIGAAGTAIVSVFLFNEPITIWRAACLLLIVGGIVGLKVTAG
ncbi:MAG: multidrug efflux SMR transporter [Planctomycetota bacterium]|nr:multidrug efflux SMR transporter [Planctomycetota bacterium]